MSGLVDEGEAVDVVCPAFTQAFSPVSRNTLIDKLMKYGAG